MRVNIFDAQCAEVDLRVQNGIGVVFEFDRIPAGVAEENVSFQFDPFFGLFDAFLLSAFAALISSI